MTETDTAAAEKQLALHTLLTQSTRLTARHNTHSTMLKAMAADLPRSVSTTSVYVNNVKIFDPIELGDQDTQEAAQLLRTRLADALGEGEYIRQIETHVMERPDIAWIRSGLQTLYAAHPDLGSDAYFEELGPDVRSIVGRILGGADVPAAEITHDIKQALHSLLLLSTRTAQYLRLSCDQAIVPYTALTNDASPFMWAEQVPNGMAATSEYRSLRIDTSTNTATIDKNHTLGIAGPSDGEMKTWGYLTYSSQSVLTGVDPFLSSLRVSQLQVVDAVVDPQFASSEDESAQKKLGMFKTLAQSRGFTGEVQWHNLSSANGFVDLSAPTGLDADSLEKLARRGI